jgi:hypothetical protein
MPLAAAPCLCVFVNAFVVWLIVAWLLLRSINRVTMPFDSVVVVVVVVVVAAVAVLTSLNFVGDHGASVASVMSLLL